MEITKQEHLQNVLDSHRMAHISELFDKFKEKREDVKEALEANYTSSIYSPINSGSFAKYTAINVKFDLDLVVPFKRNSFDTLENMFNDVYEFLQEEYRDQAYIRPQKVSIGIEFYPDNDGNSISLDIVPGRELNQNQYFDDKKLNLYVNSTYGLLDEKSYIQTNIQAQIDHIKARENERKIIRLLKIWKTHNSEKYKSFLLELLTIKAFEKEVISGNLWEKLKSFMTYIKDNITKEGFTLIDPGNSGNDVMDSLNNFERQSLSGRMDLILKNIENNEDNILIYFPLNNEFADEKNSKNGYGVKKNSNYSVPPPVQRFG